MKREVRDALRALAELEGKSEDAVLGEMVGARLKAKLGSAPTPAPTTEIVPTELVHDTRGNPIRRQPKQRQVGESAAEAEARWRAQEAADPGGVLGPGGMSAGGIFGTDIVATEGHDPSAVARASTMEMHTQLAQGLQRLERRLAAPAPAPALQPHPYPPLAPPMHRPPVQNARFIHVQGPSYTVVEVPPGQPWPKHMLPRGRR